jgi:BASS family bile acid:Na+ symporter
MSVLDTAMMNCRRVDIQIPQSRRQETEQERAKPTLAWLPLRAKCEMKYLLPSAVLILMLSIGISLKFREIVANWRRLTLAHWSRLLLATFILPPLIALGLGQLLPLSLATTAGLFLIAVAPGAPLLTRNIAKRGFDMQMAASYQVWSAMMIPIMIPLLVALAGNLYQRDI